MKSLRANLFISMGCVLLAIALLSFFLPTIFIRKDINNASSYLTLVYNDLLKKLDNLSKSWVTYRFIHTAAQLDAVSQSLEIKEKSEWEIASSVLEQDPGLSLVQVSYDSQIAVVSPESGKFITPSWKRDEQGRLWIQIPNSSEELLAEPLPHAEKKGTYYALYAEKRNKENQTSFTPFQKTDFQTELSASVSDIYQALSAQETMLFQKMLMIRLLIPLREKALGLLFVDASFRKGMAILTKDVLFTYPVVAPNQAEKTPFIVFREQGPYVNLAQIAEKQTENRPEVVIAYSLSNIASEIAHSLERPVLLSFKSQRLQGFTPEGKNLPVDALTQNLGEEIWQGVNYEPFEIPLLQTTFTILIPVAQKTAITHFLNKVRDSLVAKISGNLLSVALLLFALALVVLARISKRITKPITQLALASEEIGKGNYQDLNLPPVEKRHDEIAILSHSFQKMVVSLRDREKIRGVLNKVVSKEIASKILTSNVELGGELRKLTMLFSDIRSFTPLSETMTPQKLITMLNSYMTRMCRVIDETHGVVDKFVGDEIMALYGAPVDLEDHAEKAVEAGLLMIAELNKWNLERGGKEPPISVGIGIHTGVAFAGNMGAENRLNYTVVGANVNLASRLCSAAKPMQVLISEDTYNALPNTKKFRFEKLTPIPLKGIDHLVPIYSVLSLSEDSSQFRIELKT